MSESMQLKVIESQVQLKTNMAELKNQIRQEIDNKYNVVVTQDTVKESKKLMADINKDKAAFNKACKQVIDDLSFPINEFKKEQKNITAMFDEAYQSVKKQVANFEAERLKVVEQAVRDYTEAACAEKDISSESITTSDLVILSSITAKGSLTAAARSKIDNRIAAVEADVLRKKLEAEE